MTKEQKNCLLKAKSPLLSKMNWGECRKRRRLNRLFMTEQQPEPDYITDLRTLRRFVLILVWPISVTFT